MRVYIHDPTRKLAANVKKPRQTMPDDSARVSTANCELDRRHARRRSCPRSTALGSDSVCRPRARLALRLSHVAEAQARLRLTRIPWDSTQARLGRVRLERSKPSSPTPCSDSTCAFIRSTAKKEKKSLVCSSSKSGRTPSFWRRQAAMPASRMTAWCWCAGGASRPEGGGLCSGNGGRAAGAMGGSAAAVSAL